MSKRKHSKPEPVTTDYLIELLATLLERVAQRMDARDRRLAEMAIALARLNRTGS